MSSAMILGHPLGHWLELARVESVAYLSAGGMVAIPLGVMGLVMWYLVGLRSLYLRRGITGSLGETLTPAGLARLSRRKGGWHQGVMARAVSRGTTLVEGLCDQCRESQDSPDAPESVATRVEEAVAGLVLEEGRYLSRYRSGVRVIAAVSPLLGLLGTVNGMIETFNSLTRMALFAQSGGVAGGISEALVSTQIGLFVAIPGLLVGRILDSKEERLRNELEQLRSSLTLEVHQRLGVDARPAEVTP